MGPCCKRLQQGLEQVQQQMMTQPTRITDSTMMPNSSTTTSSSSRSAGSANPLPLGSLGPGATLSQRVAAAAAQEAAAADVAAVAGRMEAQQRQQLMERRRQQQQQQGTQHKKQKGKQTHSRPQQQQEGRSLVTVEAGSGSTSLTSCRVLPPSFPPSAVVGHMAAAGGVLVDAWLVQQQR
jgi:hypothetical protein